MPVKDFLLFIDTETNGLPKKWNKPYDAIGNWPHIIQLAWIVYTKDGTEIKRENHFIKNDDFNIKNSAIKIHGITEAYLKKHGKNKTDVMQLLANDIEQYQPMLVGHFMELDFHMINAEFFRSGLVNPVKDLPLFCTMLASKSYSKNPSVKYLRLPEFYNLLFNKKTKAIHNALIDVENTVAIFFELVKRGDINEFNLNAQQNVFNLTHVNEKPFKYLFFSLIILIIILLICLYYAQ